MSRAWAIFSVCSLGFVLSMFYRVSPTVIAPELTRDLNLTPRQLSDLSAMFFYAFAACQIPLGLVLDRVGIRLPFTLLSLLGASGALVFAWAGDAGGALWGRALLGVGMSCNLMGPLALLARWFPPTRFATVSGLLTAVGSLGFMLAATPLAWMTEAWGWRGAFQVIAVINYLQAVALYAIVRDHPSGVSPPPLEGGNPLKGLGRLLRMPAYWGISLATFCRFGSVMALQGLWAGPYLMEGLGLDAVQAGNVLLLLSLGGMLGMPLFGRISDRVLRSRKRVVVPSLFFFALLMALLVLFPRGAHLLLLFVVFALLGMFSGAGQVMYAHIKELVPRGSTATALTGINLFTMLGPAAMMQLTGLLMDSGPAGGGGPERFHLIWYFLAGTLLLSGLIYCLVPDSRQLQEGESN